MGRVKGPKNLRFSKSFACWQDLAGEARDNARLTTWGAEAYLPCRLLFRLLL